MAKQKGIIRVKGLLGELSFYQSGGKDLVKTPGGASKEKIATDPGMVRVRENMGEFGGSAVVGKAMRTGLAKVVREFGGRIMTGNLVKVFVQVCKNGTGLRGQRDFEIVNNAILITGFNFNVSKLLGTAFSAPYTFTVNVDRNETTFKIPDFNSSNYVHAPEGTTHFRLIGTASILSDYSYNPVVKKYEPVNPTIQG